MEHRCTKEGELLDIKGRVKTVEDDIKKLHDSMDILRLGHSTLELTMGLIKQDMGYTRTALDKIDKNVEALTNSRINDEYVKPLEEQRTKNERRQSQFEGGVIGMIVTAVMGALFALLTNL